jgi:hypothetical protein
MRTLHEEVLGERLTGRADEATNVSLTRFVTFVVVLSLLKKQPTSKG